MEASLDKFNYYISRYYDELLVQKDILKVLNNYLLLNDAKILFPLLKYKNSLSDEFINNLISLKDITMQDEYDYNAYDVLLSKVVNTEYFNNIDIKNNYLESQIKKCLNKDFDPAFLTKFMIDRNFGIVEINDVLDFNNKNNKVDNISLDVDICNDIDKIIHRNYKLVLDYMVKDKASIYLTKYRDQMFNMNKPFYKEPIFVLILTQLINVKKELNYIKDENIRSKYLAKAEDLINNALELEKEIYGIKNKKYNIIYLNDKAYDKEYVEVINRIENGKLDYQKGLMPNRIIDIDKYIVRINSYNNKCISFIENNNSILVINTDDKDNIIASTCLWFNDNLEYIDSFFKGKQL